MTWTAAKNVAQNRIKSRAMLLDYTSIPEGTKKHKEKSPCAATMYVHIQCRLCKQQLTSALLGMEFSDWICYSLSVL